MDSLFDILLGKSLSGGGGGGGGGTSNYNALENKPSINSVTLTGNKSLSDLGIAAASNIPTVNNGTLTIQKNGTKIDEFKANQSANTTINITVPTTASDVSALPSSTKYAAALSLTINSSTYVVTGQLKDQNGDNLGSAQTIDLPLETMVVGGSYDDEHKKIVLTLKNGNTVDIPVADLVSGLQTELSATNKLDPAFINYDSTHAVVTEADKTAWSSKQDALTFDGTYSASTNKAATVSTVTNAINALDVTGDSGISAAKTISAWSETDGKVSVSTQDIAITGTQAVLTGYQKSTTAGQAVVATDNVNQAIGKVEKRVSDNENNILLTADQSTQYNYMDFNSYGTGNSGTIDSINTTTNTITVSGTAAWAKGIIYLNNVPAGTYRLKYTVSSNSSASAAITMNEGSTQKTSKVWNNSTGDYTSGEITFGNDVKSLYITANNSTSTLTNSVTITITNVMLIPTSVYNAGFTDYQPYALPNAVLTPDISYLEKTGKKNWLKPNTISGIPTGMTIQYESDDSITINGTYSGSEYAYVFLHSFSYTAMRYTISCNVETKASTYYFYTRDGHMQTTQTLSYTYSDSGTTGIAMRIAPNTSFSNVNVKLMIRPSIITDSTYQPYAPSNRELYEMILAMQ